MAKKEEDNYRRWIQLIKAGNFQEVSNEIEVKQIDEKQALGCVKALAELSFDATKGIQQIISLSDAVGLTQKCSANFKPDQRNSLRYLTSLYHITNLLYEKDHFDEMAKLLNIIVGFKDENLTLYKTEGVTLHNHFIKIVSKAVIKVASKDNSRDNLAEIVSLLEIMWKLLVVNKTISNGVIFLQNIQQGSQILGKQDQKAAVRLITAGLKLFNTVDAAEDLDACLSQLFIVYMLLYSFQFNVSGHHSALSAVGAHLDQAKWKWSKKKVHAECFMILNNTTQIFNWNYSDPSFTDKVQDNINVLTSFQGLSKDVVVNSTCSLIETMLMNPHKSSRKNAAVLPKGGLKLFLRMLFLLHGVFSDSDARKMDHMKSLSDIFVFINSIEDSQRYSEQLKQCVEIVVKARSELIGAVNNMILINHRKAEKLIRLTLNFFVNLLRTYKKAGLLEDVINLGKMFCQFACSLSSEVLKDSQNQYPVEMMFTILVSVLGTERLDDALEALVAWLLKCPQDSKKIFKVWGDIKHNAVCYKRMEHLNISVHSVVTQKKFVFEHDWFKCELSSNEIGKLLVEELNTYSQNTNLRGEPVIAVADTLQSLSTDCVTQVEGLVVAMEVTSAMKNFEDQCLRYYSKSKTYITLFRKEKKRINPVQYNLCMGNLLYVQLLCEIRCLRKECETEMVRLSVGPQEPLISELPEDRPNPDDTCDIATKYSNLCLAKQRKLLESVDSAMRHWGFAYSMLKEHQNEEYDMSMTLRMLQGAGLLLQLYCDKVKQEKVWKLLYDVATLAGDVNMIVIAVGEMLNMAEEVSPDLIDDAEKLLQLPQLSNTVTNSFYLNRALYHLAHDEVADGLKLLRDVESKEKNHITTQTQLLLTVGLYQRRCDLKTYNHQFQCTPSFHFSFHRVATNLLFLANDKKWISLSEASQIHLQMLRVSQLLGEANWALEQPREARCYLKTFLAMAQKLALPLRTVQLLVLLAWVDLSTGNVSDCAVKMESLEDLLELCGTPVVYQGDSPHHPTNRSVLSSPDYLDHPPACSCLPCTTEEYRRLVLETVTLRATFCANFGRLDDSLQCFKVAICVEEDLSRCSNGEVLKSCSRMWMCYADVLASTRKYQDAMDANQKAMHLLLTVKDPISLQRVVEQKTFLQFSQQPLQLQPIGTRNSTKTTSPIKQMGQVPKTPKNTLSVKMSALAVVNDNTTPITPFARPTVRPLKLPSSGDENTPPPVSVSKSKRKTKQLPKFITETPQATYTASARKASRTPFVIVDDDGNVVGVSGKKTISKTSEKVPTKLEIQQSGKNGSSVEVPKKRLFNLNTESSNLRPELAVPIDSEEGCIVRKSNRKVGVKTYGKSKMPSKVYSKVVNSCDDGYVPCSAEDQDGNEGVFDFNGMKNAIDQLKNDAVSNFAGRTRKKVTPTKLPRPTRNTTFCDQIQSSQREISKTRSLAAANKAQSKDDDCDVIEGTPPEYLAKTTCSLNLKRTTRSKKL